MADIEKLSTDYVDDVLDTADNTERIFNIVQNGSIIEEKVSLQDVTKYLIQGTNFGASDINKTNQTINIIIDELSNKYVKPSEGIPASDLADGVIPTSLPANGGNASTVNGKTVKANVPEDAKFTDTLYTLPIATNAILGGIKSGANITNTSGTLSLTKDNVTDALGYTPPTKDTITTATTTGTGNAVTAVTATNGALTVTKGATFLTGHQSLANCLQYKGLIKAKSTNLNAVTDSGIYYQDGTALSNAPNNPNWSYLIVLHYGSSATQIFVKPVTFNNDGKAIAMREYTGNPAVWSAWRYI